MSGTKAGGMKAAKTNLERHGADFYKIIGHKGGKNGHTGGFAANPELARKAGAKGGRISRRGPAKKDGNDKPEKTETIETPEHGKQENIHMWKRVFGGSEDE
jgi:general stress protein YciG